MSGWIIGLLVFAIFYVGLCYFLWANQRALLFRPWKFLIDPRLCAVSGVELVDVQPSPEEKLYVWHLPPQAPDAPVILYLDGNRGNISIWNRRWRRIAAAGAGFIAVSYRGYGGSTQQPSENGIHEDARHAWNWAVSQYPAEQVAIHGFSLGTGFAAKLASDVAARALILEAPYTSAADRGQEMMPIIPVKFLLKDKLETKKWIRKLKSPLLITHGDRDMIVPLRHGKKLYKKARKPKKFVKFPGCNHLTQTANGLYPVIWNFLDYTPSGEFAKKAYQAEQHVSGSFLDKDEKTVNGKAEIVAQPHDKLTRYSGGGEKGAYRSLSETD